VTHAWNPSDYANHNQVQRSFAEALLERVSLGPEDRVLDIGCGDGGLTASLSDRVPRGHVLGVDNSRAMIDHARATHLLGRTNLRFEVADARDLPYERQFSLVFSNAALHWILDHRTVIAGIARALEKEGTVALSMGGYGNVAGIIGAFERVLARPSWDHPGCGDATFCYGFHRPEDYAGWLRAAGLEPQRVQLVQRVARFPDRAAFAAHIRTSWHPYMARVPEECREALVQAVVEEFVGANPDAMRENDSIANTMIRLEVQARRG
jgi:trans-aconitate methyltransferase